MFRAVAAADLTRFIAAQPFRVVCRQVLSDAQLYRIRRHRRAESDVRFPPQGNQRLDVMREHRATGHQQLHLLVVPDDEQHEHLDLAADHAGRQQFHLVSRQEENVGGIDDSSLSDETVAHLQRHPAQPAVEKRLLQPGSLPQLDGPLRPAQNRADNDRLADEWQEG